MASGAGNTITLCSFFLLLVICCVLLALSKSGQSSYRKKLIDESSVVHIVEETVSRTIDTTLCNDTIWLSIRMPKKSYFKFTPPTDQAKWDLAKYQACIGEQVLLKESLKVFPNYLDFLDGDIWFRKHNLPVDIFMDKIDGLNFLTKSAKTKYTSKYPWQEGGKSLIPDPYDFREAERAPVVRMGYFAFDKDSGTQFFEGRRVGEVSVDKKHLFRQWKMYKDQINTPFILMHSANENWGLLSTYLPNRTTTWGSCCNDKKQKMLWDILDNENTLLFLVNQHYNMTHPKLISMPRGIPLSSGNGKRIVWDSMRFIKKYVPKNKLVFTSSSSWGPRPQITACVANKFRPDDFIGRNFGSKQHKRLTPAEYYHNMGSARLGLALPGLGYDSYRLWEMLTFGIVPIIEKGIGLDKSLWRLPALIVEDFNVVTPDFLRQAYVEALYRAKNFEFERLTQSFWFSFIANVSTTKSIHTVLDKFPIEAEDPDFARPMEPFTCWKTNSCGPGTKKIPETSC